jgi:glycosyl-4,4'-diaponeurosporenoate acyltransferase
VAEPAPISAILPLVHLADPMAVAIDVIAWGVVHAGTGYAAHRLPERRLVRDGWLLRPRSIERDGRMYERFRIRRWKDRLPEAGALFAGGVSKRKLPSGRAGLERFAAETRRAELAHWWALSASPLFLLWNPPLASTLLVAYGVTVNLPFIAIQRYNRLRVRRVVAARSARAERRNGRSMP